MMNLTIKTTLWTALGAVFLAGCGSGDGARSVSAPMTLISPSDLEASSAVIEADPLTLAGLSQARTEEAEDEAAVLLSDGDGAAEGAVAPARKAWPGRGVEDTALYERFKAEAADGDIDARFELARFALTLNMPPVARRGDLQHPADRLDPVDLTVLVNERVHHFKRRSSSA